ncbi:CBS domain-containing protein [Streptomyces sp. ACA25]|uniref:CBS domain-containing protein n=1 Tax=Streptomyces sp. ACA25 TaxID=3022596 RepID=UPI00230764CF|nr:CBS domain-containing protein [Streptomyces sp. ACA25]MDB1087306.1 CBS domain-containing protein [Streptomyces sp. ACA25]
MKHQKIGHAMTSEVVSVTQETPFKEIAKLLTTHRISGLPVIDDDEKVLGVISQTDLVLRQADRAELAALGASRLPPMLPGARKSAARASATTAGELMTSPAITVRAEESIAFGARTMAKEGVERLPVVDEEDRLVGIVTRRDLLQVFLRPDEDIHDEVVDEVLIRSLWLAPNTVKVTVDDGVVTLAGVLERSSEVPIAARMTSQVDGVVSVVNQLTHRLDDSHLRPEMPPMPIGGSQGWLRHL